MTIRILKLPQKKHECPVWPRRPLGYGIWLCDTRFHKNVKRKVVNRKGRPITRLTRKRKKRRP